MKFQRNKVRGVSSALYWLLILGVVASYFAITAERDPAPSASVSMDRVTADALADAETGRKDDDRPRADALRAFPPHTDSSNSDDSAPLEGRRTVRSGNGQTATRRDSAPQPADLASSVSDAGGPADEEPSADDSSAEDREKPEDQSQTASAPDALGQSEYGGDRNAGAGDRDTASNDKDANAQDEEEGTGYGGDFGISGQVVDESGRPVSGIEVEAVLSRLFDEEAEVDLGYGPLEQTTVTDGSGGFQFFGLPDGEYQIRTVASRLYPVVASTVSRSGLDSVKLVVVGEREVWISGFVEGTSGEPLAGAEITAVAQPERTAVADQTGNYRVQITMKRSSNYAIRYWAEGYREQTVRVGAQEAEGIDGIARDVTLEPERALTVVAGTVTSDGSAVEGERVYLKSSQTRLKYDAVTDKSGAFVLNDVEIGNDYILWISPQGSYRRYRENGVDVPPEGLDLAIALQAEGVGRLAGQMVDFDGNPVPHFSLVLRSQGSTQQPITVTGDGQGYFALEQVPEGRLSLGTSSLPKFQVSGIQLPAGQQKEVELILDIGGHAVQGQVLDLGGDPVPAANVIMSWVYREGGITHESLHKTVSSADGRFEFTQLGPGERTVTVAAPGFETVKLPHDVGGADDFGQPLQVQLEAKSS